MPDVLCLLQVAGTGFEPVCAAYEAAVVPLQLNPQSPYRDLHPDYLFGGQMCWSLHHTDWIKLTVINCRYH